MDMTNANEVFAQRITRPGLNIGSGVYCAIDPSLSIALNARGEYEYVGLGDDYAGDAEALLRVSAFGGVGPSEDEISARLYGGSEGVHHHPIAGYYQSVFAGWASGDTRNHASSGGIATWALTKLLATGQVDGVIHMGARSGDQGPLFSYRISRTAEEVVAAAKTRYFPGELSGVLDEVRRTPGRYALVAIPSIIYEVRLLQELDPLYKERITFVIGLICGHQKSAHYAEYLGWQAGFAPGSLRAIDFRKKLTHAPANSYSTEFTGLRGDREETIVLEQSELDGTDWGHGFFKSKFSDFTEDALNECADLVLGDAWLPRYVEDSRGTNIVIARSKEVSDLLNSGLVEGEVHLESISIDDALASQSALVRQNVVELPYRVAKLDRGEFDAARLRRPATNRPRWGRRQVQAARRVVSRTTHDAYLAALATGTLETFDEMVGPLIESYARAQRKALWNDFIARGPRAWARAAQTMTRRWASREGGIRARGDEGDE